MPADCTSHTIDTLCIRLAGTSKVFHFYPPLLSFKWPTLNVVWICPCNSYVARTHQQHTNLNNTQCICFSLVVKWEHFTFTQVEEDKLYVSPNESSGLNSLKSSQLNPAVVTPVLNDQVLHVPHTTQQLVSHYAEMIRIEKQLNYLVLHLSTEQKLN